jgi:hypothetical protein
MRTCVNAILRKCADARLWDRSRGWAGYRGRGNRGSEEAIEGQYVNAGAQAALLNVSPRSVTQAVKVRRRAIPEVVVRHSPSCYPNRTKGGWVRFIAERGLQVRGVECPRIMSTDLDDLRLLAIFDPAGEFRYIFQSGC